MRSLTRQRSLDVSTIRGPLEGYGYSLDEASIPLEAITEYLGIGEVWVPRSTRTWITDVLGQEDKGSVVCSFGARR